MKLLSLFTPFTVLSSIFVVPGNKPPCRCISGQECWPTQAVFRILASKVSQPLIHPVPPATSCYDGTGNCSEVISNWSYGNWRSNQTGAMQITNYETYAFPNGTIEACYLNTTLGVPCEQANVPVIGVDARSADDVSAGVRFASENNLPLVIRNTGWAHNRSRLQVGANSPKA